jgi:hypothetical protein
VNGFRALRLEPRGVGFAPTLLGGYHQNVVNGKGSTIAGGGTSGAINQADGDYTFIGAGIGSHAAYSAMVGAGAYNSALGQFSMVGSGIANTNRGESSAIVAGTNNTITAAADHAFIGGGQNNTANSTHATIGGGTSNTIETMASHGTIGGGLQNTIQPGAFYAIIGGGYTNTIHLNAAYATLGGGFQNTIQTNASSATIGGGLQNVIRPYAFSATIGGGNQNTIGSNAPYATIPGGLLNRATNFAFAAGYRAKADHTGAFVWADSQDADFASTANNQFLIRAGGGVGINKPNPASALDVNGTVTATGFSGDGAGLTNLTALTLGGLSISNLWTTTGNAGANLMLGTTDTNALEFKVNGTRALRLEPATDSLGFQSTVNVVGGSPLNFVGAGVRGATIGGGGIAYRVSLHLQSPLLPQQSHCGLRHGGRRRWKHQRFLWHGRRW